MSFSVPINLPNRQVGALLATTLVDEERDYVANFNTEYTAVTLSGETREIVNQAEAGVRTIIKQIINEITRRQTFLPRKYAPLFHMPQGQEAVTSVENLFQVEITFTNNNLSIESLSRAILQASQQGLVCARHLRKVTVSALYNEDATPSANWSYNGYLLPGRESQVLEDLLQFGGQQVRLLGNDYTIDFREMTAIGESGGISLQRSPPITSIPEQQILLNVVGLDATIENAVSNLQERLSRYCKDMSVSLGTAGVQPLLRQQQVTNFCRQYCVDFSFRTDGAAQQLLSINGPCEYLDRVHVLIRDFVHSLPPPAVPPRQQQSPSQTPPPAVPPRQQQSPSQTPPPAVSPRLRQSQTPPSPVPPGLRQFPVLTVTSAPTVSQALPCQAPPAPYAQNRTPPPPQAASAYPVPALWTPQLQDCEFKPVPRLSQEWNEIVTRVRATLTTAEVTEVERVQNRPLWERYCLEGRQMSSRNNGETNEKYLFHGTRDTNPRQVVQSDSGIDFRYSSRDNRLMWGNGAYFAENASYSNSYSYRLEERRKQMLIVSVLTGISYCCRQRKEPHLTRPPERVPNRLYDTVYGESAGSGIYVVYDHFKSCPAYLITYT